MQLFAFGVNHKTAPVDVREKLAFPEERLAPALREVCSNGDAGEAAILSTCNRTEVYAGAQNENIDRAVEWLCDNARISCRELQPHLYRHTGSDAVKHAFRVASGLVSLVLGEPQILGQMKTAFTLAHKAG
ncbi:MAG: glutamyl-tRNA reductase, partial [Gammaproteobacteria bacterium]